MNREKMRSFITAMWANDKASVLSFLSPAAKWNLPRSLSASGIALDDAEAVADLLTGDILDKLYQLDTIEIDKEILVVDEHGAMYQYNMKCKTRAGNDYENTIVLSFALRDGKIIEAWEHMDTLQLDRIVFSR